MTTRPETPVRPREKHQSDRIAEEPSSSVTDIAYREDGVDLTLIRWMLSLTPAERLEVLEAGVRSLLRLRGEQDET